MQSFSMWDIVGLTSSATLLTLDLDMIARGCLCSLVGWTLGAHDRRIKLGDVVKNLVAIAGDVADACQSATNRTIWTGLTYAGATARPGNSIQP